MAQKIIDAFYSLVFLILLFSLGMVCGLFSLVGSSLGGMIFPFDETIFSLLVYSLIEETAKFFFLILMLKIFAAQQRFSENIFLFFVAIFFGLGFFFFEFLIGGNIPSGFDPQYTFPALVHIITVFALSWGIKKYLLFQNYFWPLVTFVFAVFFHLCYNAYALDFIG